MSDDNQFTTSPPRPIPEGARSWRNLSNIIERLAFMTPFKVVTVRDLQVLLAVGEEGGIISFTKLTQRAGVPLCGDLRAVLAKLSEAGVDREGVVQVSADGSTVTLTESGKEACNVWNLPLSPLNEKDFVVNHPPVEPPPVLPEPEANPFEVHTFTGKVSHFGGPQDMGVSPSENLALYPDPRGKLPGSLFLAEQPAGTTGTARRLNPNAFYIAMRWAYQRGDCGTDHNGLGVRLPVTTPRSWLINNQIKLINPRTGKELWARAVDWGPNGRTKRIADVSPGVMKQLGLATDDEIKIELKVIKEAPVNAA